MSRFYEFIQRLSGEEGEPAEIPPKVSHPADEVRHLRQILSMVETDSAAALPRGSQESASVLTDIPAKTVEVSPAMRLAAHTDVGGPAADRYRFLRLRLRPLWEAAKLKSILVTSPLPRDGKTTVALNLAATLADKGVQSVLMVDADLHQSTASRLLGCEDQPGLTDCLTSDIHPFSAIRRLDPLGWYSMAAGQPSAHPTELLQNDRLPQLIKYLTSSFDWVIFDAPPVLPLTDAALLNQHTDGTLLVARADRTARDSVEEVVSTLGKKRIIGMVLNGAEGHRRRYGRYGGYYRQRTSGNPDPLSSAAGSKTPR
jgi:capsular exopolysaccharide synthesis family protein